MLKSGQFPNKEILYIYIKNWKEDTYMKNFKKKVSALVLTTVFATMQVSAIDTGLGAGNGGAVINNTAGGFAGMEKGVNSATLKFNGDTHVNWNTLNVNSNETLNFNAVDGATGVNVLNTVNQGMTNIYGQINANNGIAKLIISNPNGVFFNGAKFTAAGDALITTQALGANFVNGKMELGSLGQPITAAVSIQNSDFSVGGDLSFVGDTIDALKSAFNTKNAEGNVKFTTTNGQDYTVTSTGCCSTEKTPVKALTLDAISVDGNVYIVTNKGKVSVQNGGTINGNLNGEFNGNAHINQSTDGARLKVSKDVNLTGHGEQLVLRHTDVKGNVNMTNDKGYVDMGSVTVKGDATLTTQNFDDITNQKFNHYVHVVGQNEVDGNLTIDSAQNIHIGGYKMDSENPKISNGDGTFFYNGKLIKDAYLKVGGNLDAKTNGGHIMTTANTTAKNINYEAKSAVGGNRVYGGNILSDGESVLTAETYQFKADGYIGGLKQVDGGMSVDNQVINLMEAYTPIPADIETHDYLTVAGGTITKIETPKVSPKGNDVQVYIKSNGDVVLTGANAGDINMTAPKSKITITGDVHAKEINVGPETDYLKLDFPERDFTTNYTNIRDEKIVTIRPDEEITYELTDELTNGYNSPTLVPGEETTYLIGPDKQPGPEPDPQPGPEPDPQPGPEPGPQPGPEPQPQPDPEPQPQPGPQRIDDNENAKLLHNSWAPADVTAPQASTPVAFAADLDDDDEAAAVRKNVDGSVTVVRAFPMGQ